MKKKQSKGFFAHINSDLLSENIINAHHRIRIYKKQIVKNKHFFGSWKSLFLGVAVLICLYIFNFETYSVLFLFYIYFTSFSLIYIDCVAITRNRQLIFHMGIWMVNTEKTMVGHFFFTFSHRRWGYVTRQSTSYFIQKSKIQFLPIILTIPIKCVPICCKFTLIFNSHFTLPLR